MSWVRWFAVVRLTVGGHSRNSCSQHWLPPMICRALPLTPAINSRCPRTLPYVSLANVAYFDLH